MRSTCTHKFFSKAANRHYVLPKEAVDAFMELPPEKRVATWGYPSTLKDGETEFRVEMSQIGVVTSLVDLGHNVEAVVSLDMVKEGAKMVTSLLEGGKQLTCGLSGYGHVDERGAVMDSIEYVAISEPPENGR